MEDAPADAGHPWARRAALALCGLVLVLSAAAWGLWHSAEDPWTAIDLDGAYHLVRAFRLHRYAVDRIPDPDPDVAFETAALAGGFHRDDRRAVLGNLYPPGLYAATQPLLLDGADAGRAVLAILGFYMALLLACAGLGNRLGGAWGALGAVLVGAGSPLALLYSHRYYLDVPVAAMVGMSLWALTSSDGFRRLGASLAFGLLLGLGCLVKFTCPFFVLPAIAVVAPSVLGRAYPGFGSRLLALAGLAAAGAAAAVAARQVWHGAPWAPAGYSGRLALFAGLVVGLWLAVALWEALLWKLGSRGSADERAAWGRFRNALFLAAVVAGPWYLLWLHHWPGALLREGGGLALLPSSLRFYLTALALDLLPGPLVAATLAASVWGLRRQAAAPLVAALWLPILLIGVHHLQLGRYLLPSLAPAAALIGGALASARPWLRAPALAVLALAAGLQAGSWLRPGLEPHAWQEWGVFQNFELPPVAPHLSARFPFYRWAGPRPMAEPGAAPPRYREVVEGLPQDKLLRMRLLVHEGWPDALGANHALLYALLEARGIEGEPPNFERGATAEDLRGLDADGAILQWSEEPIPDGFATVGEADLGGGWRVLAVVRRPHGAPATP